MTAISIDAVGFCAHYSNAGDWAFDLALRVARHNSVPLNVFHFLSDPYDPADTSADNLSKEEKAKLVIERERELRMYYDERAGDYLEVGFRLCEDREWTELHRCLLIREFQVLILGSPQASAIFAGRSIETYADAFVCPVVLVGPSGGDEVHLNSRAALIADQLGLPEESWSVIKTVSTTK